jgi:hypothetical protein
MTNSSDLIKLTADWMSNVKETSKEYTVVYITDMFSVRHNINAHFSALQLNTEKEYFV